MGHLITVFFILLFVFSYIQDRRKVTNGFLLTLALLSIGGSLAYEGVKNPGSFYTYIFFPLFILLILFIGLSGILFIIFSFFNTRKIYKKEGVSLKNSLILALGVGIILLNIATLFNLDQYLQREFRFIFSFARFSIFYFSFFLFMFTVSALLYQVYFPKLNKDYIIVLGSGLIGGDKVPPLLQSRIKKGVSFYQKQLDKNGKKAKIIFTGGQGHDEFLAEGEAMANFARSLGLEDEQIIIEDQAKNTYENMRFSAEKMDAQEPKRAVFVTNNYHLLRAGIYAKKANLDADGIGARTAFYFIPNAFIREFIAFMNLYRKSHIIIILSTFIFSLLLTFFYNYLN
ncbi:YdcF family protein [Marinilactibacillus kalidii]|uniref:YdcF family protein n=1 Tax=Marinilactibacillus kalidii TaxID=2820274 RepID=UPI001ABE1978|nr:YdcF family protein [Marinilactibacillus kalidii]